MRRFTHFGLVAILLGWSFGLAAQFKPAAYESGPNAGFKAPRPAMAIKGESAIAVHAINVTVNTEATLEDPSILMTKYDLQTNSSCQNRVYLFPDGTIGGTGMMSHQDNFNDRGTGVNYFSGGAWGTKPTARIESSKAGWPSYAPWGPNGEIVVTHHNTLGLFICTRPQKGTGAWTESILAGPSGAEDISWPRVVTTGPDHMTVHIICLTYVVHQGLNLALLYYRSPDGGTTWDIEHQILPQLTSAEYLGFKGDNYNWAEPKGDTLCFVIGDSWSDLAILKSNDGGDTWNKTVIWPCPYNKWAGGDTTGIFWCPDGSLSVALDKNGKAHVVTGLQRANGDDAGNKFWYPFTDGLLYWNEDMPTWPEELDPVWLDENGYYIGWVQDTMVFYQQTTELAYYYVSLSSHPTVMVDMANHVYVVWSGVTTFKDANSYMLRHIYARAKTETGWRDAIVDLTSDFLYQFMECAYPSISPTSTMDKLQILFQGDDEGGVYLNGQQGAQGQNGITENEIIFLNPNKMDIVQPGTGMQESVPVTLLVAQNHPNPVQHQTTIRVNLRQPSSIDLAIHSSMGQKVTSVEKRSAGKGSHEFVFDASGLAPGVYFYTVTAGNERITRKMIVE